MNFLVKMVSMVQNKGIIWLVLDQKRFAGKIRIEFYTGGQSSNFLKFKFYSLQMCYLNMTQKFLRVIERALQNMSMDLAVLTVMAYDGTDFQNLCLRNTLMAKNSTSIVGKLLLAAKRDLRSF